MACCQYGENNILKAGDNLLLVVKSKMGGFLGVPLTGQHFKNCRLLSGNRRSNDLGFLFLLAGVYALGK